MPLKGHGDGPGYQRGQRYGDGNGENGAGRVVAFTASGTWMFSLRSQNTLPSPPFFACVCKRNIYVHLYVSGPAEVSVLKTIEVDVELSTAVNVGLDTDPSGFADDDDEYGRGEYLPPNERSQQRPQHEEAYLRARPPSIALPLPLHTHSGSHQWPASNSNSSSTAHSPSSSQPWAYALDSVKELDGSVDSDDNEGQGECKDPLTSPSMPPSLPPSSPSSFPMPSSQTRVGGSVRRGGGRSDTGLSARSPSPRSGSQEMS